MFCVKCGMQLPDDAVFCTSCGTRVNENSTTFCTKCGTQLAEDAAFCTSCGTRVNTPIQQNVTEKTEPTFSNTALTTQTAKLPDVGVSSNTNESVTNPTIKTPQSVSEDKIQTNVSSISSNQVTHTTVRQRNSKSKTTTTNDACEPTFTPAGKALYSDFSCKRDWFPADVVDEVLEKMKTVDKKTANKINECGLSSPSSVSTINIVFFILFLLPALFICAVIGNKIGLLIPIIVCGIYRYSKCDKWNVAFWNLKDAVRKYNLQKFEKATNSNCEKRNEVTSSKTAPNQGNSGGVFYAFVGSTKTGPLKDTDIVSLAAEGKINNQTLMWKKGMKAWAQASAIPEVNKILLSQSEATYYVYLDNNKVGPMSITDIESLIKSGKINSQTLVWKNGLKNWTYASNVPEINKIR